MAVGVASNWRGVLGCRVAETAIDSAVPVMLFVMAVPEALRSLEESDWKTDWMINGISAAVWLLISSVEVWWYRRLFWLCSEL